VVMAFAIDPHVAVALIFAAVTITRLVLNR
jgi:hypothetical protein